MRKYRIIEINNHFYPEEKNWFSWVYLDNLIPELYWYSNRDYHSICNSKVDAEMVIQKRIKYLTKQKKIIHEYKQQDK